MGWKRCYMQDFLAIVETLLHWFSVVLVFIGSSKLWNFIPSPLPGTSE